MRDRIIMTTAEEINLRGFKFTMSDLTKRLHISKTSLYEHFSSKNELIAAILDMVLTDYREQEEKIYNSELSIIEKFKAMLTITPKIFEPFNNRVYDDLRVNYPEEWQKVTNFHKDRMDRLTSLLIQGMESGCICHVNVEIVKQILISTMNDLISYRFLAENNLTYPDAVAAMLNIIIYGLKTRDNVTANI